MGHMPLMISIGGHAQVRQRKSAHSCRRESASVVDAFAAVVDVGVSGSMTVNPSLELLTPLLIRKVPAFRSRLFFESLLHQILDKRRDVSSRGGGALLEFRLFLRRERASDRHGVTSSHTRTFSCVRSNSTTADRRPPKEESPRLMRLSGSRSMR